MEYSFKIIEPMPDGSENYTELMNMRNAIFLAGPCPRHDYNEDWRYEAFKILNDLHFTGNVITPTNERYKTMEQQYHLNSHDALKRQTEWERIAMYVSSALVFWIPRSGKWPARTTNIEFGEWYKKDGVYVGWPDDADHNEYLGIKLEEVSKPRYDSLTELLTAVVNDLGRTEPKRWMVHDTKFSDESALEERITFADLMAMDLEIISNWNKHIRNCDIVYHGGNFSANEADSWLWYLDNLNFATLHLFPTKNDMPMLDSLKNYSRPIIPHVIPLHAHFTHGMWYNMGTSFEQSGLYPVETDCHFEDI